MAWTVWYVHQRMPPDTFMANSQAYNYLRTQLHCPCTSLGVSSGAQLSLLHPALDRADAGGTHKRKKKRIWTRLTAAWPGGQSNRRRQAWRPAAPSLAHSQGCCAARPPDLSAHSPAVLCPPPAQHPTAGISHSSKPCSHEQNPLTLHLQANTITAGCYSPAHHF